MSHWKKITATEKPNDMEVTVFHNEENGLMWLGCKSSYLYGRVDCRSKWNSISKRWESWSIEWNDRYKPTHFLPLSEPPKKEVRNAKVKKK